MGHRHTEMPKRKSRKGGPSRSKDYGHVLKLVDKLSSIQPTVFRRICNGLIVGTNGAGVIPASNMVSSNSVNTYPDFSSFASLYTMYRVHAFKLRFFPAIVANTTALNAPTYAVIAPFRGGLSPSTIAQMQESPDALHLSGYKQGTATVSFVGDNDAHLWTPINVAIAASESFGLSIVGSSVLATASTNTWYVLVEAVVEFKMTG